MLKILNKQLKKQLKLSIFNKKINQNKKIHSRNWVKNKNSKRNKINNYVENTKLENKKLW